jgi:hypothetical protein
VLQVIYCDKGVEVEGLGVNTVSNNSLVAFYVGDDSYDSLAEALPKLPAQLLALVKDGVTVQGKHCQIALCLGGDMKFLNSILGLCGCSSTWPCIYCYCSKDQLHLTAAEWEALGGLQLRFYAEQLQLAHIRGKTAYKCPAPGCGKNITPDGPDFLPVRPTDDPPDKQKMKAYNNARRKHQKGHYGGAPGKGPWVADVEPAAYVSDVMHVVLRLVPAIFKWTMSAHMDADALVDFNNWFFQYTGKVVGTGTAIQSTTGGLPACLSAAMACPCHCPCPH